MTTHQPHLETLLEQLTDWIAERCSIIGATKAVIGVSGGKDSSVVSALCAKALGPENVYGVLMPDGEQADIDYAYDLVNHLGIPYTTQSIKTVTHAFLSLLDRADIVDDISNQTRLNLAPRVRMTLLYAISQSLPNSLVINTSNLSEDWVGYATIYGDTAGAFSPVGMLTSDEVVEIGRALELPEHLLVKAPSDGLTGKTDEDILGFSYAVLNRYIREGIIEDEAIKVRIDHLHRISRFKFQPIPMFDPKLPIVAKDIANVYTT